MSVQSVILAVHNKEIAECIELFVCVTVMCGVSVSRIVG